MPVAQPANPWQISSVREQALASCVVIAGRLA
jgi:hypothetical protein